CRIGAVVSALSEDIYLDYW
nr:immunoglobulin heavy chain junction region [Macaca mulatta]MOW48505.1 immunoglobulin heavy chain junction region [Macaca mulatta]MOW50736.1 immunoglobulin heavy chain junction region [Macaca mulatta]